jgi:hypothetical protein
MKGNPMNQLRRSALSAYIVSFVLTLTILANSATGIGAGTTTTQRTPLYFEPTRVTLVNKVKDVVTGNWKIVQVGANGAKHTGILRVQLQQNGSSLLGLAEWDHHNRGSLTGEVKGNKIKFSIEYGGGLIGSYHGKLSSDGNQMLNGEARSNKASGVVKWRADKVLE